MFWSWSWGFYCCNKHPAPKGGGKGLFHLLACNLLSRKVRAGTQGSILETGTEQRPWRNGLVPLGLLSFVSSTTQDYLPKGSTTPVGWSVLHQSSVETMPHRLVYRPLLCRHFSSKILSFKVYPYLVKLIPPTSTRSPPN